MFVHILLFCAKLRKLCKYGIINIDCTNGEKCYGKKNRRF